MSNSASTYYGPIGETPSEIFLEKTFMAAGYLTGFGYGLQLILYVACVRILLGRARSAPSYRRNAIFLIAYISVLSVIDTIWTGVSAYGLQSTFIDNRNYPAPDDDSPGGPIAYLNVEFQRPFNIVGQVVFTLGNVLADALLLYRCRVIWGAPHSKMANIVMAFPTIMLLASIVMGVMFGIETCSPNGLFGKVTAAFGVPYFTISLSLNIILTFLIVGKIWYHRRSMISAFGEDRSFLRYYEVLAMMFVESAAMYSIVSVLLLVTFALGHPINQIWLSLAPATQMISNYLIIYRVAQGRAWGDNSVTASATTSKPSRTAVNRSISFSPPTINSRNGSGITSTDSETAFDIPLGRVKAEKADSDSGTLHIMRSVHTVNDGGSWSKDSQV